jgi:hypothetical protein
MLSMENKKEDRYSYNEAIIEDGKAKPIEEQKGNRAFSEVGIWVTGKEKEGEGMFKVSKTFSSSNVRNIQRAKRSQSNKAGTDLYYTGTESLIYLFILKQWNKKRSFNESGYYVIGNISEFTREIEREIGVKLNRERVKQAIIKAEEKYPVSIVIEKIQMLQKVALFEVKIFRKIDEEDGGRYITFEEYEQAIKETNEILEIWVKPEAELRKDMRVNEYGEKLSSEDIKKLGYEGGWNTLVSDSILSLYASLNDLGKRILSHTLKTDPEKNIGYETLTGKKHLNIGKRDIKNKGNKRIREEILEVFNILLEVGYLEYFTYSKSKDMFYWKCTNKWNKHPQLLEVSSRKTDTPEPEPEEEKKPSKERPWVKSYPR